MTITIGPTFILWSPVIFVGVVLTLICLLSIGEMSRGGAESGLIGGMLALAIPIAGTPVFAAIYFLAAWMGHKFWP